MVNRLKQRAKKVSEVASLPKSRGQDKVATGKEQNTGVQWVTIDSDDEGQRVDNYLLRILKGVPRTRVYRMLRKGELRLTKKGFQRIIVSVRAIWCESLPCALRNVASL